MKNLLFVGVCLMVILSSCHDEVADMRKTSYSFSLYPADHSKHDFSVRWGVNGYQYNDPVSGVGYGSAFDLRSGEHFTITVSSSQPDFVIEVDKVDALKGTATKMQLKSGQEYELTF